MLRRLHRHLIKQAKPHPTKVASRKCRKALQISETATPVLLVQANMPAMLCDALHVQASQGHYNYNLWVSVQHCAWTGSYPCMRPTMMRSAPFARLHSFVGCHTPPAASHSGCVPSAQLAPLQMPPTAGSVHSASLAIAARALHHPEPEVNDRGKRSASRVLNACLIIEAWQTNG